MFFTVLAGSMAVSFFWFHELRSESEQSLEHHDAQFERAIQILNSTSSGQSLIRRAKETWGFTNFNEIRSLIRWGPASRTDAVLTRQFNPETGEERRERKVTIYLKVNQSMVDLILDIAHELTHAVSRPVWDPYDPDLTPGKYILAALEGTGGEVEALVTECQVASELPREYLSEVSRCHLNENVSKKPFFTRHRVRADLYRVGKWHEELGHKLGSELARFPLLSSNAPLLFSSTGNAPYPVSLMKEFEEINQVACANSRRRIHSLSEREPASELDSVKSSISRFLSRRCLISRF
jgi:hypothetical protein